MYLVGGKVCMFPCNRMMWLPPLHSVLVYVYVIELMEGLGLVMEPLPAG